MTFLFFFFPVLVQVNAGPDQHYQVFELVWGGFQVSTPHLYDYPVLSFPKCAFVVKVMISDVLKCCQSNLVALPFVSKLKSNKSLRWLNCCFKQSVFSACPRQTSGRLVLMFTNRTRWQSLKRASLESLTPACVSAGKHTDSIHLLTYYLQLLLLTMIDCLLSAVLVLSFALVIQWLDHTGRSVYVMF